LDFSDLLLTWYDQHGRSLPWRGSHDPYIIWVSEIIFQQTRIEQGTGYFLRFVERFPDLVSLALANEDEVLRLWQGLGYYSRARNMLFTARYLCENYEGVFPEDFKSINQLKGIGDYTASCITSICYGQPHAAVDGNVYRVLSRVFADATPIDTPSGKAHFKHLAQKLISIPRPGDFNEALMDLGATICKPRSPSCSVCPLINLCHSEKSGTQIQFPVKSPSRKKSTAVMNYLLINPGKEVVISKREGNGIWRGLYELPMVPGDIDPGNFAAECMELYGLKIDEPAEITRVRHLLSHTELDIRFFSARAETESIKPGQHLMIVAASDIQQYPFPKPLVDFLAKQSE